MSDRPVDHDTQEIKKKPNSRRVPLLLLLLIGALALSFVDRNARAKSQQFYDKIDSALADDESIKHSTVQQWRGKQPDRITGIEGESYAEEYEFRGIFRKQTVIVGYTRGSEKLVNRVALQ